MSFTAPLTADILVAAACWEAEPEAEALVQRAIEAAAQRAVSSADAAEVAIVLTDDSGIRTLNRDWRGIDKPTNVLSFPAVQTPSRAEEPRMLGDIAIAYETTRREAESDADAETMESLEREILAGLGVPDPYV
jgi:probable rRNA maturation factor